ncbi:MAG: ABC transporter ATP-binding protein/permease [Oscillospiraceae bacterium]|nr:MAG: ABC transporter ATP-binding protein/permease [Oscillospiraceae bacterium]
MLLAILNGVIAPLNAYILKILVEKITVFDWNSTLAVIGIIAAVNLTNGVLQAYINRKLGITGDLFRNHLMFEFNSKVVNMDYEILFEPEMIQMKELAFKTIREGRAIRYLDIIFSCISYVISLASIIYLLSSFSWWVYLVMLGLSSIKIYTVIADKKHNFNISVDMAPINAETSYYMNMLADESYANDMRMFSISRWVISKYERCIAKAHKMLEGLLSGIFKNTVVRNVLSGIETVFLYTFVASQMFFNNMTFADFTMATSALRTFSDSITNITGSLIDLGENSAYVKIYREFMKKKNTIAVPGRGRNIKELPDTRYIYELADVGFKYPGSERKTLEGLNLQAEKGKFYVIVGKNGVGKTTLVRLLCRLYDPSSGIIRYMNNDLRDLEYKSYRDNIGVVFQDYKYYCLSIAENVAMNEYDGSEEVIKKISDALNAAGLSEKINSLPKGINTQLGKIFDKDGILLSGGELQKLALARVLFKNSSVVILDEPSSALDALAEDELIRTFNTALKGKTVFYISHRLSVAKYADKVIFMEDSGIKGFDTHEKLLESIESYRVLYESQAKHYK